MAIIPRKNNLFFVVILTVFIILSFSFTTTVAAEDLVYKQPRPMKALSGTPIKSDGTGGKGMIIEAKGAEYIYDPTGKTDPFKSFIDLMEEVEKKKRQKPKTYLETLDLSWT